VTRRSSSWDAISAGSKGLLLVAGATLFWSLSGVFVRWAPEVPHWTFNAWRGLGMALSMLVWMVLFYRSRLGALLAATDPRAVLISGGCFALGSTLYILSMQLASVAAVSCVSATSGLFAALLAHAWLGERAGPRFYAAMALAIAGVAVIAFSESAASFNGLAGSLVALLVAITFAAQSVSLRRYRAVGMEPAMLAGGLVVFLVLWLGVGLQPIPGHQVAMLLFMGAIQLALPLVLFMRGARHVPAAQMVLVSMADALLNPLWVWLVFGEVPASGVFAGGSLVLLAIVANAWFRQRSPGACAT
jgi:DME family drug/metabolite transporter